MDEAKSELLVPQHWQCIAEIPHFPFTSFVDLKQALAKQDYSLGLDSLAAATWVADFSTGWGKTLIKSLSLMLYALILVVLVSIVIYSNYWLLLALPFIVLMFVISTPSSPWRQFVSVFGAAIILLSLNLWLQDINTPAYILALGAITFVVVRVANYINHKSFHQALISQETVFLSMFEQAKCTLRNNKTGEVYIAKDLLSR